MRGIDMWKLPPLILHPFSRATDAQKLAGSAQGNMMRQDLPPHRNSNPEVLRDEVLDSRYREIRWLYYIGKDIVRWIDQCLEFARTQDELNHPDLHFQSFAELLTENPPQSVRVKLHKWGVFDFKKVFSRAIGINTLFAQFPAYGLLSEEFLRNYYRYSDCSFVCRQDSCHYLKLDASRVQFDIYTSGEYSSILERGLIDKS
jgi:hypothetical protein